MNFLIPIDGNQVQSDGSLTPEHCLRVLCLMRLVNPTAELRVAAGREGHLRSLASLGIVDDTIVVLNGDHGETLAEHECWFDHHGLYDPTLIVPLIIRYPRALPSGARISGYNQHKDLVPTILELAGIKSRIKFDGQSLLPLVSGEETSFESEIYITECTWMRNHGWRTP